MRKTVDQNYTEEEKMALEISREVATNEKLNEKIEMFAKNRSKSKNMSVGQARAEIFWEEVKRRIRVKKIVEEYTKDYEQEWIK